MVEIKFNDDEGDEVLGTYIWGALFEKLSLKAVDKLTKGEILFAQVTAYGAMGYINATKFLVNRRGVLRAYVADFDDKQLLDAVIKIFPIIKSYYIRDGGICSYENLEDWHRMYIGAGNRLLYRAKFDPKFRETLKPMLYPERYHFWYRLACQTFYSLEATQKP